MQWILRPDFRFMNRQQTFVFEHFEMSLVVLDLTRTLTHMCTIIDNSLTHRRCCDGWVSMARLFQVFLWLLRILRL